MPTTQFVATRGRPTSDVEPGGATRPSRWGRRYRAALVAADLLVVLAAAAVAIGARFGLQAHVSVKGIPYLGVSCALAPVWVAMLALSGAYDVRHLGTGSVEFKRVINASVRMVALIAGVAFALKFYIARGYLAYALPLGVLLLLLDRYLARRVLHRYRAVGRCVHRVVAVGDPPSVLELYRQVQREPYAGFVIVAACVPDAASDLLDGLGIPIVGSLANVRAAVAAVHADTVAVTAGPHVSSLELRRLSWQLEGSGTSLVVAPRLTDVAGPRISIRPVAGLPLLYVEEPDFSGPIPTATRFVERVAAGLFLLVCSPVLGLLALGIRATSPGPALFRQRRVGQHGAAFTLFKLRTMSAGAESDLESLQHRNEAADGLLFKIRQDPRVTTLGRWLRKFSIDELPQLWNVVKGDMALVGPRPPLASEVERYADDVRRRLLVKPGITGLWQVSGRSDLSWEDSVRLDLYYVENWSPALEVLILWKTLFAVLRGRGAY